MKLPESSIILQGREVGSLKNYDTPEEIKSQLEDAIRTAKGISPDVESFSDEECPDIIITLTESNQWTKVPSIPSAPAKTVTQRLFEWGTNFMYNAKDGKNLWYALLGDQKLDLTKPARILSTKYDLGFPAERQKFMEKFKSFIWMTYRTNFFPLLETITSSIREKLTDKTAIEDVTKKLYTSDNGWGCTIRVGQMAFANALLRHVYGDNFMLPKGAIPTGPYEKIILLFWDNGKGQEHPFSIQNFAKMVLEHDKLPGEWLSQSTVAAILNDLNAKHLPYKDLVSVTFVDGVLYEDQLEKMVLQPELEASTLIKDYEMIDIAEYDEFPDNAAVLKAAKKDKDSGNAIVVFVSCALGLKKPEENYLLSFKKLFDFPQLIGVMGGRASEALFFVGYQNHDVIFFDPHLVQQTICKSKLKYQYTTYHCESPKVLNYEKIDTSICAVFYVKGKLDLINDFLPRLRAYSKSPDALIHTYAKKPDFSEIDSKDLLFT